MKKGIIFDFDGLMIDTELAWHDAYEEILTARYNYKMRMEDFLTCIGSSDEFFISKISDDLGIEIENETLLGDVYAKASQISENLPLMKGVREILDYAKENNIICSIGTSSDNKHLNLHLDRLDIRKYFTHIVTSNDVASIKPKPDIYNKAADLMGIAKEDIIIFEDSLNGLIAGNSAGIDVVVVENRITEHIDFPETYLEKVSTLHQYPIQKHFEK